MLFELKYIIVCNFYHSKDGKDSNWSPELIRDLILEFRTKDDFETVSFHINKSADICIC
jgi:hypothetical protein